MNLTPYLLLAFLATNADPLGPGDHSRSVKVGDRNRKYLVHVPKGYDAKKPTPVVLALHGAAMNGKMMTLFFGLDSTADKEGFVVVYPDGTGSGNTFLTWNAGGFTERWNKDKPDDVAFMGKLLDDLAAVANVDTKRVYATGMSNGAMMTYRLASEMSDRIAAVAPVAGTMTVEKCDPKRPVPVLHFHGTEDSLVRFEGLGKKPSGAGMYRSVDESILAWVKANGCNEKPEITDVPNNTKDGMKIQKKVYSGGKDGAEVILYVIEGGGHTWPGKDPPISLIGKSTKAISANDLMWEFFKKHPMK